MTKLPSERASILVLSPPSRSRLLLGVIAVLLLGLSTGVAFFTWRASLDDIPIAKQVTLLSFACMAAALIFMLLAAAYTAFRGSLLWANEQAAIVGKLEFTDMTVMLPLSGPCQVTEHQVETQDGTMARTFGVSAPSADLGRVILWSGSDSRVAERWQLARVTPSATPSGQPPAECGVSESAEGAMRLRGGWGGTGILLTLSLMLLVSPLLLALYGGLRESRPALFVTILVLSGISAGYLLLRQLTTVELWVNEAGVRCRSTWGGLTLSQAAGLSGNVWLNLSRYPWVSLDDALTGTPVFKFYASASGPTLAGIIWLTAALRRRSSPGPSGNG